MIFGSLPLSVDAFKTAYKVDYIPSRIWLSETGSAYTSAFGTSNPLVIESYAYLLRLWPKLNFQNVQKGIDWNGSGTIEATSNMNGDILHPSGEMVLEGDRCLMFFLPRNSDLSISP